MSPMVYFLIEMEVFSMNDKKKTIAFFAPTKQIYQQALALVEEHSMSHVLVSYADTNIPESIQNISLPSTLKVVISRGGTATYFRKHYPYLVLEMKSDVCDIIECYNELTKPQGTIAVIGVQNIIYGFNYINQFISNPVKNIYIDAPEKAKDLLQHAYADGIRYFIGDTSVKLLPHTKDIHSAIIGCRDEEILEVLKEADLFVKTLEKEEQTERQTAALTDYIHNGILSLDKENRVTIYNPEAQNLLGLTKNALLHHILWEIFPEFSFLQDHPLEKPKLSQIVSIRGKEILMNFIPVRLEETNLGMVITLKLAKEISELEHELRRRKSDSGFIAKYHFEDIIYQSESMKHTLFLAKEFAQYDSPILIYGKSGVGKEMVCQSIHNASPRAAEPFVAINCAAIPPTLIESELFGYEDGAFTGARHKGKPGVFELAHRGTIFLDEISDLPYEYQGRLLRVVQEKQIMRIGGAKVIPVDVRIICASNKNLFQLMCEGKFREDLFFRINILNLNIPSLDARKEDISCLVDYFYEKYSKKYQKKNTSIPSQIKQMLENRAYVGNIRELEAIMERCVILGTFDTVLEEQDYSHNPIENTCTPDKLLDLKTYTQAYIERIYNLTGGSTKKTCEILKINRSTLWKKLSKSDTSYP